MDEEIQIEEILVEANAYGLRNEVNNLATNLYEIYKNESINKTKIECLEIAFVKLIYSNDRKN